MADCADRILGRHRQAANPKERLADLYRYVQTSLFDSIGGLHQYVEIFISPRRTGEYMCKLTMGQGRTDPKHSKGVFLQMHDQEVNSIWKNPQRKSYLFPDLTGDHVLSEAMTHEKKLNKLQRLVLKSFKKAQIIRTTNRNRALRVDLPQVPYAMLPTGI